MDGARKEEMKDSMKEIRKELKKLTRSNKEAEKFIYQIINKRIKKTGISTRCYFVRKVSEYISEETWDVPAKRLAFLAEMSTCVTYLENQLIDRKEGVITHKDIVQRQVSAQIIKNDLIPRYIRTYFPINGDKIKAALDNIFASFSWGEYIEYEKLNLTALKKNQVSHPIYESLDRQVDVESFMEVFAEWPENQIISQEHFLRTYFSRTYLINTALYEQMTRLLLMISDKEEQEFEQLIQFARWFGLIQQLVNDITDFVPFSWMEKRKEKGQEYKYHTKGKKILDTFADMRNGIVSLPLMMYHNSPKVEHHLHIQDGRLCLGDKGIPDTAEGQEHIAKILLVDAIPSAMKCVQHFAHLAKGLLPPSNDSTTLLLDMLSIAENNTYYEIFLCAERH